MAGSGRACAAGFARFFERARGQLLGGLYREGALSTWPARNLAPGTRLWDEGGRNVRREGRFGIRDVRGNNGNCDLRAAVAVFSW